MKFAFYYQKTCILSLKMIKYKQNDKKEKQ